MIQANELRLGNYVKGPLDEVMKVTILGHLKKPDYIHANNHEGFGQNGFDPIPLTPEILEKCGFVYCTNVDEDELYIKNYFRLHYMEFATIEDNGFYFYYDAPTETKIKYLHQLQNLYFALTGEELEVRL